MNFSIQAIIRDLVAPDHQLSCSSGIWRQGLAELKRRGMGIRESGAFLIGSKDGNKRRIRKFIYYDDLAPHCLDSGVVIIDGSAFGRLWQVCRDANLEVVADVHTHPGKPYQSLTDQANPMIGIAGHIAIIIPNLAQNFVKASDVGVFVYRGNHRWHSYFGKAAAKIFYISIWS